MNGNLILLDTNIVLYIFAGQYNIENLPECKFCISFITEMELLSYSFENKTEEDEVKKFIESTDIIEMNNVIKYTAVNLRKQYKLKLPDAIICATALFEKATLVTNDEKLHKIKELRVIN